MEDIEFIETEGRIVVRAPYDADFVAKAKARGGRWAGGMRAWRFDLRDREAVLEILRDTYGWAPHCGHAAVRVSLAKARDAVEGQEVRLAGRRIAWRLERDEPVRLADGAVVVEGRFDVSGGSVRCPEIGECDDVVLEIRELPAGALDVLRRDGIPFEIVEQTPTDAASALDALRRERAGLQSRIDVIDSLIAKLEQLDA